MLGICALRNPIQHYAWGSREALAELTGRPVPSEQPEAELWMGAHPAGPSEVRLGDAWVPLPELLLDHADEILGAEQAERFDGQLPFLMKVLAAASPLSIQAHPDADGAREGFERENQQGIALDAAHRNYRDPYPKPELICALTEFHALCGFREPAAIAAGFEALGIDALEAEVTALRGEPTPAGLERFFAALMGADRDRIARAVEQAGLAFERADEDAGPWLAELAESHPADPGALAPLVLHVVTLEPGQALYLGARELHSYLEGVGIEIMRSSDNVLRGGLTPKHVDVPELLRTLHFEAREPEVLEPRPLGPAEATFDTPALEFELGILRVGADGPYRSATSRGPQILLVVDGEIEIVEEPSGKRLSLPCGSAVLVPDAVDRYTLEGGGGAFRASLPR